VTAVDRPGISTDYRVHHCVANKNEIETKPRVWIENRIENDGLLKSERNQN
jgi:hypothetical protein